MAQVFLSYAREDRKRAQAVSRALEKAGHSVWWDRNLAGGSEYSNEIATALDQADVVVVLWSQASVASPWVRDEAARGRDRGRLVPATVDGTEPPLGFGQFHTIDLKHRSAPALNELCGAVDAKASGAPVPQRKSQRATIGERLRARPFVLVASLLLLVAAVVGVWLYTSRTLTSDKHPVLAVMPFADMSPSRDQAAFGEGVAEQIMTLLSGTPGVRVIGRSSAWQLASGEVGELRAKLGATHLLEGSVRPIGNQFSIAARLIATDSGEEVWSEEFRGSLQNIFEVQEAIGSSVSERLRGTFIGLREAHKARAIRTSPEAYKLYLNARAVARRRDYESQLEAQTLLERALAIDPKYAPAHAFMAITLQVMDNVRPSGPDQNPPEEVESGVRHARTAIKLAPEYAEGHVGLGMSLYGVDDSAALRALEKGTQLDPGNFYAQNVSGHILWSQCRFGEAAERYRRAIAIEPLLFLGYVNLTDVLAEMGRNAEAAQVAARFAAAKVDPRGAAELRGAVSYWSGNLAESYRASQTAADLGPMSAFERLFVASLLNLFGRHQEAVAALPDDYKTFVSAYWRGNYDAAAAEAAALGPRLWDMWNSPQVVGKAMVNAGRSKEFVSLFYGRWQSLDAYVRSRQCSLNLIGPTLVVALREAGRNDEAEHVLNATAAEFRFRVQNGLASNSMPVENAAILTLRGRKDQALAELEQAVARGWLNQGEPFWVGLNDPAFAPLASEPRMHAVKRRIATTLAKHAADSQRAVR